MASRALRLIVGANGINSSMLYLPLLAAIMGSLLSPAKAQEMPDRELGGYVTAVSLPTGFALNGQTITLGPETRYELLGEKTPDNSSGSNTAAPKTRVSIDALQVGAFVRVIGTKETGAKAIAATSVSFRNDWDKKLTGYGVVERVLDEQDGPVFLADGYRIRVGSGTEVAFGGNLKTLAEVGPNTWVAYIGKRDGQGILVASSVKFVPAGPPAPKWLTPKPKTQPAQVPVPPGGALIDDFGNFKGSHAKVRLNDAGGWCGWHRVPANAELQARILRIGQNVIPAYQKQLPDGDPTKITFRFYAVDEDKIRSELACEKGLILVPVKVVERLQNDDQLAALLADGVALNMQMQSARLIMENRALIGAEFAADLVSWAVPGVNLGVLAADAIVGHNINAQLEEERGRMALGLMENAGYDPHQAPETWRRLWPKDLPKDTEPLKYPNRSGYQLGILNLQYSVHPSASDSHASVGGSRESKAKSLAR